MNWVVGGIGGAVAITTVAKLSKGEAPKPTVFIGGLFAAIMLSFIAQSDARLANSMGALILVGALFTQGQPLLNGISKAVGIPTIKV